MKNRTPLTAVADPAAALRHRPRPADALPATMAATLEEVLADGTLVVRDADGAVLHCDCLDTLGTAAPPLAAGDQLLVHALAAPHRPVVIGRIGRCLRPAQARIEASESVSIKCGEASLDLRADGKVVIRGDDVLVRAKGTKRIRAGAVSIN